MTLQNTKNLKKQVAPFEKSTTKESVWQIINTVVPFIILWYLAYISLSVSYWLALVPVVIAAGFLTRIFIIFHDCTHHSFFKNRRANRIVGTVMGVLTLFPFDQWGMSILSIMRQVATWISVVQGIFGHLQWMNIWQHHLRYV